MSSLVRRMQRANGRRRTQRSGSAGPDDRFGSMVGVTGAERGKPKARGSRRGKRNDAYLERREGLAK